MNQLFYLLLFLSFQAPGKYQTSISSVLLKSNIAIVSQDIKNPGLSRVIDSLKEEDQKPALIKDATEAGKQFQAITRSNFPLIRKIFEDYGFPGYKLVGKPSSDNYWMLVQHSDFDIRFQKRVLKFMKKKVENGDASGDKFAYLEDRILINEGKKQIYGTQVNMSSAGTIIKPCVDTFNLDKRRLAVGLAPIKEYLKKCDEVFFELNKGKIKPS